MKKMKKIKNYLLGVSILTVLFASFVSCDDVTPALNPNGDFTYVEEVLEVTFTSTVQNVKSLSWDFGDGTFSTDYNPVHKYAAIGDYIVKLTINGESGSKVVTKTVNVTGASEYMPITLENGDFQLPADGMKYTSYEDVPGWSTDVPAADSGRQNNAGYVQSLLAATEPKVFQLTNHVIEAGQEFRLTLGRISDAYQGEKLNAMLYYDTGDGVRNELKSIVFDVDSAPYELFLSAAEASAGVGYEIGIEFYNPASIPDSWVEFDDVKLGVK